MDFVVSYGALYWRTISLSIREMINFMASTNDIPKCVAVTLFKVLFYCDLSFQSQLDWVYAVNISQ